MEKKEYTKLILEKMDRNKTTCEICLEKKIDIFHTIIDHGKKTVTMICHGCFPSWLERMKRMGLYSDINL